VFNRQGTKAYLGTNSGLLGSAGLAVLDTTANSVTQFVSTPGKVLAVARDGSKVIVSDTTDVPNQVFVFDTTSSTSSTFQITGATAADFSPDSLKAYIVAQNVPPPPAPPTYTLYVYSKFDALQTIPLTAPANDVSFLANGIFGYIAGPAGITFHPTCDDPKSPVIATVIGTQGDAMIRALPDGATMLTVTPPNIQTFTAVPSGKPVPPLIVGCPIQALGGPAFGFLTVTNTVNSPFNLGQGNFVPTQLIISQDGSTAYIVTSNLSSILVFNIVSQTSSAISLIGNAMPLSATLTPDGTLLYVGASDKTVHVVNLVAGGDIQQISFPQSLCQNSVGQPFSIPCYPDLVAVKP
jgi:WD40 repeat protein